jgi:putative oxidoreductase
MVKRILYSEDHIATALLLLRIGIGISFMIHGFPKLFLGGAVGLGKGLAAAGIPGGAGAAYLAALAEFLGGMTLIAGLLFRPTTVVLAFTMFVALIFHLNQGDSFIKYSHALESGILFVALLIAGPGRFSLDRKLFGKEETTSVLPLPEKRNRRVRQIPIGEAA